MDRLDKIRRRNRQLANVDTLFKRLGLKTTGAYPRTWDIVPGDRGFNDFVRPYISIYVKDYTMNCDGSIQPYQATAAYLLHPRGPPVQRVLVTHRTGSGKTRVMLEVLSNYFDDPRPKIIVFPTDQTRDQFYVTLMGQDNPYSRYVKQNITVDNTNSSLDAIKRRLAMTGRLGSRGTPGELAAPLRAYSYRELGSRSFLDQKWIGSRPYDGKIIIMDEAHNLVAPDPEQVALDVSKQNLHKLRSSLTDCQDTVLALLTATPVVFDPADGTHLLEIVKGGRKTTTNEGFISSFQASERTGIFPTVQLRRVEVMLPSSGPLVDAWYKEVDTKRKKRREITASLQEWSPTYRKLLLENPAEMAPLLLRACEIVAQSPGKSIILTDLSSGFFSLNDLWSGRFKKDHGEMVALLGKQQRTKRAGFLHHDPVDAFRVFNDPGNDNGEISRVLLLNAATFSEGTDFKTVRTVVMIGTAKSYGNWIQRIGRAVRLCSHDRLTPDQRTVEVFELTPTLPPTMVVRQGRGKKTVEVNTTGQETVGQQDARSLGQKKDSIEQATCDLVSTGYDVGVVTGAGCDPGTSSSPSPSSSSSNNVFTKEVHTGQIQACHADYTSCSTTGEPFKSQGIMPVDHMVRDRREEYCRAAREKCLESIPDVPEGTCPKNITNKPLCIKYCRRRYHELYQKAFRECGPYDDACRERAEADRSLRTGRCITRDQQPVVVPPPTATEEKKNPNKPSSIKDKLFHVFTPRPRESELSLPERRYIGYGRRGCTYCTKARDILRRTGNTYIEVDDIMDLAPNHLKTVQDNNYNYVPIIFDDRGRFVGGYTDLEREMNI